MNDRVFSLKNKREKRSGLRAGAGDKHKFEGMEAHKRTTCRSRSEMGYILTGKTLQAGHKQEAETKAKRDARNSCVEE